MVYYFSIAVFMFVVFVAASGKFTVSDISLCFIHALMWPITVIEVLLDVLE